MARLFIAGILWLFLVCDGHSQASSFTELKNFTIDLLTTSGKIYLTCEEGCAWKELSFNLNNDQPRTIDEFGLIELNNTPTYPDDSRSGFLIAITKSNEGVSLTGLQGTAWHSLRFSLSESHWQGIDPFGMRN